MVSVKVLILASHHDDETLGCGAAIARLASEGHEVHVVVLGEGPLSRPGTDPLITIRNHKAALKHLGARMYARGSRWPEAELPDNEFDTVSVLNIARRISMAVAEVQPEVIFTHHFGDVNQDHRAVHEATMIATRTYASPVKAVYMYEVPGATDCGFRREHAFVPNDYQEITPEQLQRKIEAMEMYETERRPAPHPRSPEALRSLAAWRGAQAGVHLAEAFELVRSVR